MPFIIYSVLRLGLIVLLGGVLYAVGVRDLLLPVLAIVLALMVSYLVLGKQREAAAVYLAGRKKTRDDTGERFSRAVTDDAAFEDDQVDTVVGAPTAQDAHAAGTPAVKNPAGDVQADAGHPGVSGAAGSADAPAAEQQPSDRQP